MFKRERYNKENSNKVLSSNHSNLNRSQFHSFVKNKKQNIDKKEQRLRKEIALHIYAKACHFIRHVIYHRVDVTC